VIREIRDYLNDLVEAAERAIEFTEAMTYKGFSKDEKTVYAVVRAIEVMGEAVKNIPGEVRDAYPAIPWREMAGMRDKLIHEYFGVDRSIVWQTVREDIPQLLPLLRVLRSNETPG